VAGLSWLRALALALYMNETLQFLVKHGYAVTFGWVLAEQLGLPIPAVPILLAAGALAGQGQLNPALVLLSAATASVISDAAWYEIGRRRGSKVLNFLCRVSLEPDSCVRNTESVFEKHGARALLVAKFLPGFSTVAPPLAGIFHMKLGRFLLFDLTGALLWAGAFAGLGYVFSNQLELVAGQAAQLGGWLLVVIFGALGTYILFKYIQRQRFLRSLRIARIMPDELQQKMARGEEVLIVDLRHAVDFEGDPVTIPGAQHLPAEEIEEHHDAIPRDRDIILYCT
jgi:membrane protein DedA with SNARE-associated domain